MIRSSVIKLKQMTEEYNNNNNEDYSTEAIHNKSKRGFAKQGATQGPRGTRIFRV
jgi:hypothetical protein